MNNQIKFYGLNSMSATVKVLNPKPKDILVLELDSRVPESAIQELKEQLSCTVPEGVKTFILEPGARLRQYRDIPNQEEQREERNG